MATYTVAVNTPRRRALRQARDAERCRVRYRALDRPVLRESLFTIKSSVPPLESHHSLRQVFLNGLVRDERSLRSRKASDLQDVFVNEQNVHVYRRTETRRSGIVTWRHVGRGLTGSRSRLCSQSCFQWSHLASRRSPSPLPCLP